MSEKTETQLIRVDKNYRKKKNLSQMFRFFNVIWEGNALQTIFCLLSDVLTLNIG